MRRRELLTLLAGTPALGLAATRPLTITAVELFRVEGQRATSGEAHRQYQVNPLHVYDERRPAPYREPAPGSPGRAKTSAIYLRLRTDGDAVGLYGPIDREAALVVHEQLRQPLMGTDPLAIEARWDQLFRANRHSRAGHYMMALSAVDNALWDLRGRHFGVPVYRLLGGPTRPTVEAYASTLGDSVEPEAARRRSAELKEMGFRHQKWFIPYGPGSGPAGLTANIELLRTLRESVGDDVDLMFDAFMGWDLTYALSWVRRAEPYRPRWIEEAFHPDKMDSFVELRRHTSIPVASGEHFYGRWEAQRYLQAGAITVVQSDPEWCGGVSELVKTCAIASAFDAQVIPHGHSLHAALHVVASQSPMTCPLVEFLVRKMESYHHFEVKSLGPVNGRIALPETPGFGIELDRAKVEREVAFA